MFFCFLSLWAFWFSSTTLLPHHCLPFSTDSTLVLSDTNSGNVGYNGSVFKSASSEFWIWFTVREGFHGGSVVKNLPAMQEPQIQTLGVEDPLEKGMTTHSSIFAWSPIDRKPGGLQSIGSQRVEYDWSDLACTVREHQSCRLSLVKHLIKKIQPRTLSGIVWEMEEGARSGSEIGALRVIAQRSVSEARNIDTRHNLTVTDCHW